MAAYLFDLWGNIKDFEHKAARPTLENTIPAELAYHVCLFLFDFFSISYGTILKQRPVFALFHTTPGTKKFYGILDNLINFLFFQLLLFQIYNFCFMLLKFAFACLIC